MRSGDGELGLEKFEDGRLRVGGLTLPATLARRQDHIVDSAGMNKYCNPYFFRVKLRCQRASTFGRQMQFILLSP